MRVHTLVHVQARKIEDTPFPFPYAQLLSFMLYVLLVGFPLVVAAKIENRWRA